MIYFSVHPYVRCAVVLALLTTMVLFREHLWISIGAAVAIFVLYVIAAANHKMVASQHYQRPEFLQAVQRLLNGAWQELSDLDIHKQKPRNRTLQGLLIHMVDMPTDPKYRTEHLLMMEAYVVEENRKYFQKHGHF